MLLPSQKPSSSYSLLKFVYVIDQLRHPLVVHPLLRKILDPPRQPYLNSQDHYSYKMKYTINVKSVCDYNGKFIDVDIRWPGGTH